ncbi:MAG: efflux RND transporter periplasmic adaptor subunit [Oscillospiraceae bacterium]
MAITGVTTYGFLNQAIEGSGTTTPADSVSYEFSGTVFEWFVEPGDQVEAGDLLYVLDSSEVEDEILENEVELDKLYEQLADLQESIAGQQVTAPFSGRIEKVQAKEGKNVQSGTTLAQLIDDSYMKATLYFSYIYESQLYVGQKIIVSFPDQMLTAEGIITDIRYVDYVTPEGMKCFGVTIRVPNPGSLTEGTTASCWAEASDGTYIYAVDDAALEYNNAEAITANVTGELTAVHVVDYERVSAGQKLFSIDASGYENQLETVQKQIKNYEDKIVSLRESVETEFTRYADISGQVVTAAYSTNRMTGMDMGTVVIYNQDSMKISVNIDELDADQLEEGMEVYVYRTTSSSIVSYPATLTYLSLEATAGSGGVSTFAATITIDSKGELSSGVTVYYSIDVSGGGAAEETVLAPLNALCSYDDGYYLLVQAENRPENAIDPELTGGSVTDYPKDFYAIPVEVGDYNARYIQILSGVEQDATVFLRYQNTAPSGGNETSNVEEEEQQGMMPGGFDMSQIPDFEGQMPNFGGGQMPSFSGGSSGGGMPGGRS